MPHMPAGQDDALHRLVGTKGRCGSDTDRDDMWGQATTDEGKWEVQMRDDQTLQVWLLYGAR